MLDAPESSTARHFASDPSADQAYIAVSADIGRMVPHNILSNDLKLKVAAKLIREVTTSIHATETADLIDAVLAAHEACIAYADFDESEAESALYMLEDAVGEFTAVAQEKIYAETGVV